MAVGAVVGVGVVAVAAASAVAHKIQDCMDTERQIYALAMVAQNPPKLLLG